MDVALRKYQPRPSLGNKANGKYLKEKEIRFVGKQLGRPAKTSNAEKRKLQKEMAGRNEIEGKFGQGKNAYGLQKIKARIKETSEIWIMSIYFIIEPDKTVRKGIFAPFKSHAASRDIKFGFAAS